MSAARVPEAAVVTSQTSESSNPREPGWYVDPTGRFDLRYWNGRAWSRHVEEAGERLVDPIRPRPPKVAATPTSYYVHPLGARRSQAERARRRRRQRRRAQRRVGSTAMIVLVALLFGLVGGTAAALVLTADDSPVADGSEVAEPIDPLASALSDYLVGTTVGAVSQADADCMSERIIDTLGRDALVAAGIDRGADPLVVLTDDQIEAGLPAGMACLDDATAAAMMKATLSPAVLSALHLSNGDCLVDGWMQRLGRDRLIDLYAMWARRINVDIASELTPAEMDAVLGVVTECTQAAP